MFYSKSELEISLWPVDEELENTIIGLNRKKIFKRHIVWQDKKVVEIRCNFLLYLGFLNINYMKALGLLGYHKKNVIFFYLL